MGALEELPGETSAREARLEAARRREEGWPRRGGSGARLASLSAATAGGSRRIFIVWLAPASISPRLGVKRTP